MGGIGAGEGEILGRGGRVSRTGGVGWSGRKFVGGRGRKGPRSGEARANMKGVHLSCGCIYMIYEGCLYGEILIAITDFLNFGGVHMHPPATK